MDDKPGRAVIRLLNEMAELSVGLKRLGLSDEAITRICDAYASRVAGGGWRVAGKDPVPPRSTHHPEPNYGWRDGMWTDLDIPDPNEEEAS